MLSDILYVLLVLVPASVGLFLLFRSEAKRSKRAEMLAEMNALNLKRIADNVEEGLK